MHSTEIHSAPSPDPIFQMATGFWVSKTLMTAVELEVFTKLAGKSVNIDQLQSLLEIENRPAEAFVTALVSLGLLKVNKNKNGEKVFANSEVSSMFLDKSKSTYIGDVIAMFDERLYKR